MKNISYDLPGTLKEYFLAHARYSKYFLLHILPHLSEFKKTKRLKNSQYGKSCFVFANGPSLKKIDPKKIQKLQKQGFDVFGVNAYITTEFSKIVPPNYYLLSDPAYFGIMIEKDNMTPTSMKELASHVDLINEKSFPTFVPVHFLKGNRVKNYFVFNDYENLFSKNIDITCPRGYTSMTAFKSLAAACYLGYNQIYIAGYDSDYIKQLSVDRENKIYLVDDHFYGGPKKLRIYPESGETLGDVIFDNHLLFTHLHRFKKFPIINMNPEGLIDAFSKNCTLDVYL